MEFVRTMVHLERLPLASIRRAAVYENVKRLPLSKIVEEQQPDIALTGVFYSSAWKPVCPLKADGRVLYADTRYNYWALAWDSGADMAAEVILPGGVSQKANYAANCVLVTNGTAHQTLYYNADVGGSRGRVAAGLTAGGELFLFGSTDGSKSAMTPEALRDYMAAQGCEFAMMLDGGRKVNLYVRRAGVMMEGRDPSQNLILIWLNDDTKEESGMDKKKVCLDAGHDAGNLANASPDGSYYEHEFALDMSKRIGAILERHGVEVIQTRSGGEEVGLTERCRVSNAAGADLFVSLHSNAANNDGWSSVRGWECYVYGLSGARHKAARAILARVEGVAPAIRTSAIRARPELAVIKGTDAPAVLIEHGFHTNREDVALLKDGAYRQALAEAEAYGILDWLGIAVQAAPEKTEAEIAVEWITGEGIMKGNADGDLMLDQPVTRRQFAVMLYRQAKMEEKV